MTTKPATDSWETIAVDMSVEVKTKESSRSGSVGRTKDCMPRRAVTERLCLTGDRRAGSGWFLCRPWTPLLVG